MPTTRSKRKRAEENASSASPKPSNLNRPNIEQNAFRIMVNPEKKWPSYNVNKAEGRKALLEKVFSLTKEDHDELAHTKIMEWTRQWIQPDLNGLSDDQKCRIIRELEGVCLQEDWDTLQSELSQSARDHFGEAVAQAMIYKAIFTTFYENPFWLLDGKMNSDNNDVDPLFTRAMEHLYERFFVDDPELATLWRMQLFRLVFNKSASTHSTSADHSWFEYDPDRLAPFRKIADKLVENEPFRWLLKEAPALFRQEWRQMTLSRAIDYAASIFAQTEAAYGGQPLFYRIPELEAAYSQERCDLLGHMRPHEFNCGSEKDDPYRHERYDAFGRKKPGFLEPGESFDFFRGKTCKLFPSIEKDGPEDADSNELPPGVFINEAGQKTILISIGTREFTYGLDEKADLEGRRLVFIVRPGIASILSPFRKWLGEDNEAVQFFSPALVLTGRVVPVSERGIRKEKEDEDKDELVGEADASDSEDSMVKGKERE